MKTKHLFLLLAGSFLCGLICCHMVTVKTNNQPQMQKRKKVIEQKKQLIQIEKITEKQKDSLLYQKQKLQAVLERTQAKLIARDQQNLQLQNKLKRLLKEQQITKHRNDTFALLSNCDSLAAQTAEYITAVNKKDSLQQQTIQVLNDRSAINDSLVGLYKQQSIAFKQTANECLQEQMKLEKIVSSDQKAIRKHRFISGIKTAGLVLLSAILAKQSLTP